LKATFFDAVDYVQYLEGKVRLEDVKKVEVEALVETGKTFPALPKEKIIELGLPNLGEHLAETVEGTGKVELATNAIIKIEDGIAQSPIIIRLKGTTPLIDVLDLEQMEYKVDPKIGKLIEGLPLMLQTELIFTILPKLTSLSDICSFINIFFNCLS
jgi:predicted aspartyl protease